MTDVRNDCLNLIIEILEERRLLHLVIAEYLNAHRGADGADRGFVSRLVRGTVEKKITLDYVIDSFSSTKVSKMKPAIRNILRMGVYQILFMNVPDSAACNESVKLAQKRGFGSLSGFVNGNLRSVARFKNECVQNSKNIVEVLLSREKRTTPVKRLSVTYSMPEWIVGYFVSEYGTERSIKVFEYFEEEAGTTFCTVASKIEPDELAKRLNDQGINTEPAAAPGSFTVSGFGVPDSIREFEEGLFFVQDPSSTMAVNQAEFNAGDKVLDLCAAPGGKTMHAADLLRLAEPEGSSSLITSCDISERKVALIRQNIERCGFKNVIPTVNDATVLRDDFINAFDVVLCDVPCSGLGIIGRKPDIKYNMTPEAQAELVTLQRSILDNAVRYVRPGGRMIFSTCTVNRAENQENVDYIKSLGMKCLTSRQLLPGEERTDGFFYAKFVKRQDN